MMTYLCFFVGILIFAIALFFACKKRHNTKAWISIITFGVLISVFFMVLPTEWSKSENALIKPLYNIISALLYSFKVLGGRQDISQLDSIGFTGIIRYIYIFINYAAFIAAPVLGSSLVLSFVGDTLSKIRYTLSLDKSFYVFSELNENSYLVAKGIYNNNKEKKLIFCSTQKTDEELLVKAKKLHAITLYCKCEDIRLTPLAKKYDFYLVCEDEDKNTEIARALIEKHAENKNKYINITAFTQNGPETELLEDIVKSVSPKNDVEEEWIEPNINISFINKTEFFCNNIIFENPLYEMADESKNISVMIIGCGETGMCMLKTVLWNGQIHGYKLKVRIYDINSKKCRIAFQKSCPELDEEHGYDVKFIKADANSPKFEKLITENGQAENATVAYIFTGNDEFNLSVAESLYGIFRKSRNFGDTPPIFTWMNNSRKFSNFSNEKSEYLNKRGIRLVGNIESVFSEKMLFQTELERLAMAAHFCYIDALTEDKNSFGYKKACNSFINNNYNRRSSMAAAIHFNTKLHIFKLWMKEKGETCNPESLERLFKEQTSDNPDGSRTEIADILAKNEHKRWRTFMRSEGYRTTDIETMEKFYPSTAKNRDDFSRLHICITDWENLDKVEKAYNSLGNDKEFKKYDYEICQKIFEMREFADNLLKEEK